MRTAVLSNHFQNEKTIRLFRETIHFVHANKPLRLSHIHLAIVAVNPLQGKLYWITPDGRDRPKNKKKSNGPILMEQSAKY